MENISPEWFEKVAKKVFGLLPSGFEAELLVNAEKSALTRFANNFIHQNVAQANAGLSLRVINGKRVGSSSVNRFDDETIGWAVRMAVESSKFMPEDPDILPLVGPQKYAELESYSPKTASLNADMRADYVVRAVERAKAHGFEAAGIFSNGESFLGLANTNGVFATHRSTDVSFALTITNNENGTGWASASRKDIEELPFEDVLERAIYKAELNRNPKELPPGEYTVILESPAVSDILSFALYMGFGGQAYLDGSSFLVGRLGTKVFDEKLTLVDDAYNKIRPGLPFDFEGMPRQRVVLVERGVAKNLVHDRKTAMKMNAQSTGHSLPQPNTWGPIPLNTIVSPGDAKLDDMIKSTERGLLVTHFHYVNLVEPRNLILTGMTRDGLFLVENGKIVCPIKNFRFTESIPKAFSQVDTIGSDIEYHGILINPSMKLASFNFSSGTEF